MDHTKSLSQKLFAEFVEQAPLRPSQQVPLSHTEGIIKSIDEFVTILNEANDVYNKTFQIPESRQLIIAEDYYGSDAIKLNKDNLEEPLNDLRLITYLANERPAIISQRKAGDETGIRNIKWKYAGSFPDPKYTGYSVVRYSRDIEANITFKVWGKYFQDIRQRAQLLKDVIDTNVWYFKHKGLRDIIWLGSQEEETWDNKNLAKFKTQHYMIRYSEVREFREKNLEQIVAHFGLG